MNPMGRARRTLFLVLGAWVALVGFLGCAGLSEQPENGVRAETRSLPKVLIIGDSISIGYTKAVQKLLEGKADVRRIPGNAEHTGTGLRKLDEWLGDTKWDLIHFNWGLWDLCYRYRSPESQEYGNRDKVRGKITFTPEQYEANLTRLVERLKATGAKLVWASTTPVPEDEAGRFKGDEVKYNAIARRIMKKNKIAVDDLYSHMLPKCEEYWSGPGNVHFTREGCQCLARKVAESIASELGLRPVD